MKFFVLLYCLSHPSEAHPDYDCVTVSVHAEKQTAINSAHEWCLFDHLCVHHTYLQEYDAHDRFWHVKSETPFTATMPSDVGRPVAQDPAAHAPNLDANQK